MTTYDKTAEEEERRRLQAYLFGLEDVQDKAEALSEEHERLKHSMDLLLAILGSTIHGIVLIRDRKFTWLNQGFVDILGWSFKDLQGVEALKIFPESADYEQFIALASSKLKTNGCANFEYELTHKLGHKVPCLVTGKRVDPSDRSKGDVFSITDLTEQKASERRIMESERLKAIGELASGVAHNFNNLLQVVLGNCQLAQMKIASYTDYMNVGKNLEQIVRSSRHGAETVKRLQSFCKTESESEERNIRLVNFSSAVRKAIELGKPWWRSIPEKTGLIISLESDFDDTCYIMGNENEMVELALHIIKNAVESMPEGGPLTVKTFLDESNAYLQVKDCGQGIDKEDIPKIFQPFWTTKGFTGMGMGLSSSYGIVRRHHGEIRVKSDQSSGTEVTVSIPRAQMNDIGPFYNPERIKELKLNILLIDDLRPVIESLEDGLTPFAGKVFTAMSGSDRLEIFFRERVDLVISDLGMPGMNGMEIARQIADYCESRNVPRPLFILLTGWGSDLSVEPDIKHPGIDRILEKPILTQNLLVEMGRLIAKQPGEASWRL